MKYICKQCCKIIFGDDPRRIKIRGNLCAGCWRESMGHKKVQCPHCHTFTFSDKRRGLCYTCWSNPEINAQYPSVSRFSRTYSRAGAHEPQECRSERQEGDLPYRCLWCGSWACQEPLQTCEVCRAWYKKMAQDMPEVDETNGKFIMATR